MKKIILIFAALTTTAFGQTTGFGIKDLNLYSEPNNQIEKNCKNTVINAAKGIECDAEVMVFGNKFLTASFFQENKRVFMSMKMVGGTPPEVNKILTSDVTFIPDLIKAITTRIGVNPTLDSKFSGTYEQFLKKNNFLQGLIEKNCPDNPNQSKLINDGCKQGVIEKVSGLLQSFKMWCGECKFELYEYSWKKDSQSVKLQYKKYDGKLPPPDKLTEPVNLTINYYDDNFFQNYLAPKNDNVVKNNKTPSRDF